MEPEQEPRVRPAYRVAVEWNDRIEPGIAWQEACDKFELMASEKGLLPCTDPFSRPPSMAAVYMRPSADATHYLFKNPEDPKGVRIRCAAHYRESHGERIAFIPHVLRCPDEIIRSPNPLEEGGFRPGLVFSKIIEAQERFVVVVGEGKNNFHFITAYDIDMSVRDDRLHWGNMRFQAKVVWKK